MERIKKFLLKLSKNERSKIFIAVEKITLNKIEGLDTKKLKGYRDIYRVRVGSIRIIFQVFNSENRILEISRRSDSTYNKY